MKRFAKLYEFTDIGQVLILKKFDEETDYAIEMHFSYSVNLDGEVRHNVAHVELSGWKNEEERDMAFDLMEEDGVHEQMVEVINHTVAFIVKHYKGE